MNKEKKEALIAIVLILVLFIAVSLLIQSNLDYFKSCLDDSYYGMAIYVFIFAASIVIAPVSAVPLFPLATQIWGVYTSATLGILGWLIGAVIAFYIARKWGVNIVKKFISISQLTRYEKKIPEDHLFLTLVVLRMVFPMDGISYLFGLFTTMKIYNFALATFIGLIPFSFLMAYLGGIPIRYQIIVLLIPITGYSLGYLISQLRKKHKKG